MDNRKSDYFQGYQILYCEKLSMSFLNQFLFSYYFLHNDLGMDTSSGN